jgi:hypothetical protein
MSKLRGLFFGLGLTALIGLSAGEAQAASLTLTVMSGSTTVYTVTGNATAVTANVATVNNNLSLDGLGAYKFTNLGGSSSTSSGASGSSYVESTGILTVTPGGAGAGSPLTVIVTEGGFTAPTSGAMNTLDAFTGANYAGVSTGTQSDTGSLTDATPTTYMTGTATANYTGTPLATGSASTPITSFVSPITLTNTLTLAINATSGTGSNGFSGQTTITTSAVPEPASLIMMLTGMPLPVVLLGLLRRRAAA